MRRTIVLFLCSALLWLIIGELNHYLAPWQISIFAGGLFVAYPALHTQTRAGAVAVLLGGLLCDATTPVWPGTHALVFLAVYVAIRNMRDRLPREESHVRVVVALIANLAIFLIISFIQLPRFPEYSSAWLQLFADLIASQIVVALITPWFLSLQRRALVLTRQESVPLDASRSPWRG